MPVVTKDKPLTDKQHQERKERAEKIEKQLIDAYMNFETNLIGKAPEPTPLAIIENVNPETLWQALAEAVESLKETHANPHKIDWECLLVDGETIKCRAEPWVDWDQHITQFQNHIIAIQKKRRKKTRTAIHKLTIYYPTPDTRNITPEQNDLIAFAAAYSGSAAEFIHWTGGNPQNPQLPPEYPQTRLHKTIQYLNNIPTNARHATRDAFIEQLQKWWEAHKTIIWSFERLKGGDAQWTDTPTDDTEKTRWQLPLWPDTPEGKIISGWDCYSGALHHLNQNLGLDPMDIQKRGLL